MCLEILFRNKTKLLAPYYAHSAQEFLHLVSPAIRPILPVNWTIISLITTFPKNPSADSELVSAHYLKILVEAVAYIL